MGADPGSDSGELASATATNATSAVATITGKSGRRFYVTDFGGSSDKAGALILIKDGSTVIWQDRISNTGAYVFNGSSSLPVPTLGANISATVDGTALCNANILGYFV